MFIKKIELYNFRNFSSLSLALEENVNIFYGDNGQGKTNLLEAVFLVTKGESFRPGHRETLIRRTEAGPVEKSQIRTDMVCAQLDHEVKFYLDHNQKQISVNGKRQSSHWLKEKFPCILFSPESLEYIKEGPDKRRALIDDFLLSQPSHKGYVVTEYRKVLATRNKILKDLREGVISKPQCRDLLEAILEPFLGRAVELVKSRIESLEVLLPHLKEAYRAISADKNVDISVDYIISSESASAWAKEKIHNALHQRLQQLTAAEMDSGVTLVGPHKHDIQFLFNGSEARFFCSQGQQRALILSYKMAQIRYHYRVYQEYPVLLLDDVLSELDHQKRHRLVDFLKEIKSQIIITTTEEISPGEFKGNSPARFTVINGMVTK